jgi:aminoglycoside phosphotransferase (APT) family kinase protein
MTDMPGLPQAALDRVGNLLRARGLLADGDPLSARLISGGRSNITYRLDAARDSWVLRRPPLGHVLSTAHDMSREYRVLDALALKNIPVPVPEPVLLCEDAEFIGSPFYVMKHVSGEVLRTSQDALGIPAKEQASLARDLIDVMAALHRVDPAPVGLQDFGRPEGFTERQVSRWTRQLDASRSRAIPGIDRLAEALGRTVPTQRYSAVIHGDYRLDNCLTRGGAVVAVLDWEMSTLGDPLTDLALFAVYYAGLADLDSPVLQSLAGLGSYPPVADLLDRYAERTAYDLSDLEWYQAFAWFKLAAILEGIYYRSTLGAIVGEGFDGVAELVQPSVERGLERLARAGVA